MWARLKTSQGAFQSVLQGSAYREKQTRRGSHESDFRMNKRGKMQHVRNEGGWPCKAPAKSTRGQGASNQLFHHPLTESGFIFPLQISFPHRPWSCLCCKGRKSPHPERKEVPSPLQIWRADPLHCIFAF